MLSYAPELVQQKPSRSLLGSEHASSPHARMAPSPVLNVNAGIHISEEATKKATPFAVFKFSHSWAQCKKFGGFGVAQAACNFSANLGTVNHHMLSM